MDFKDAACVLKKLIWGHAQNGLAMTLAVLTFLIGDVREGILLAVMILIGLDFLSGIIAMIACREKPSVQKMGKGAFKLFVYLALMIVAKYILLIEGSIFALVDNLIYCYIGAAEILSIVENLRRINRTCKLDLPFLEPLFQMLEGRAGQAAKKVEEATGAVLSSTPASAPAGEGGPPGSGDGKQKKEGKEGGVDGTHSS